MEKKFKKMDCKIGRKLEFSGERWKGNDKIEFRKTFGANFPRFSA